MADVVHLQDERTSRMAMIVDSFKNLLGGFGVFGRDKQASHTPYLTLLNQQQLHDLYRGDWVSRKIVDLPAFDTTRAWRKWQADEEDVKKIEEAERKLGLQRKMMSALQKARLYGGSAIVIGVKGQQFTDELDVESVGEGDLVFCHVVQPWMLGAGQMVRDITSQWYGEPNYYQRSNIPIAPAPGGVEPLPESEIKLPDDGAPIFIHPSRVVRLIGNDYPDMELASDCWGDSVLQTVYDAITRADLVGASIGAMIGEAKLDVIKMPGLTETLSTTAGAAKVRERFTFANSAKSTLRQLFCPERSRLAVLSCGPLKSDRPDAVPTDLTLSKNI